MWGLKKLDKEKSLSSKACVNNRRGEREDRRVFGPPVRFPFVDGHGKIVNVDRRAQPDRRLANIQVKEDHLNFDRNRFINK